MNLRTPKVTVRERKITGGKLSLYLDFYPAIRNPETLKMHRREYLGLYPYEKPKTETEKEHNRVMYEIADIKALECLKSIINEEFGFLDKTKMKEDFLQYFKRKSLKKHEKWIMVYTHFKNFTKAKCTFGDVNIELCNQFREYLLNTKQLKHLTKKISQNSASSYFMTFRALLKMAYKEKRLRENLNDYLDPISTLQTQIEYLTYDELIKLVHAPCEIPILKKASIFACLTGLRISDVLKLNWSEIMLDSNNEYCMRITTQKTKSVATLPLSEDAMTFCGEREEGLVFKGLKRTMTQKPLKDWIKSAGIKNKNITFHMGRHNKRFY